MLPNETESQLTVSKSERPMPNSVRNILTNASMRQFASKAGSFIAKHPFWIFVIGSFGIHAAFALIAPNPIKKEEAPEVIVSALPVVKLPAKQTVPNQKTNPSPLDNLFVKPSSNKLDSLPNSPLRPLDLDSLDRLEDLPPVTNLPLEDPLLNNPKEDIEQPQFVKPPRVAATQPPQSSQFTPSGKIDNTNPTKTTNRNIKPEFQSNGVKNEPTTTNSNKSPKNLQGLVTSNTTNGESEEKAIDYISFIASDPEIVELRSKKLLKNTQIAPEDALIPFPEKNREKGVAWIPPKKAAVAGKKGTVTYFWLVAPDGKVIKKYLDPTDGKKVADKELIDIVKDTVKTYTFNPVDDPQPQMRRLVTVKYVFP
ncbi:MAG: hypothetical protein DCF19_16500 [Pseudanabaena frigida]|uniref:TonB C-terminal domain-containing protein n=1 Tax=Pseudanabaena frigida TaxID=945775 RepID=A0A2W4XSU2_9CYAN|nr:MAG: hypothetical protein DCF19_16500 [Pseudanabaena frigida]